MSRTAVRGRVARLERADGPSRLVIVRRHEGETVADALAIERPGFDARPNDLIVALRVYSGPRSAATPQ